jgi:hypothetical protein
MQEVLKKNTISNDILGQTTECEHDFVCLNDNSAPLCAVRSVSPNENVLYTFCSANSPCPYCKTIGPAEGVCTCPVRNELYKRYGI